MASNELWNSDPELTKTPFIFWDKMDKFEIVLTAERRNATRIADDSESGLTSQKKAKEINRISSMKHQILDDMKKEVIRD